MILISPKEAIELLSNSRAIDVRSELEYAQGYIPNFCNLPILTNSERHEVGLCYKQNGQNAAIELGQALVAPHKKERIESWSKYLSQKQNRLVLCWRGGLRSKIASEWLNEQGLETLRIQGGYKALRKELLKQFTQLPEMIVISGPTGSGKSQLLRTLASKRFLDLESLANHKGSAFGADLKTPQPSQQTFENALSFQIRNCCKNVFVEDESITIGSVHMPEEFYNKIVSSRVIQVEDLFETRVERLFKEYVQEPLETISTNEILVAYEKCLLKISKKLGGLRYSQIYQILKQAFQGSNVELHKEWIGLLLQWYYDPLYAKGRERKSHRKVLFKGDWESCRNWIETQSN